MIDINKIPIYCINLDKRPERYRAFARQEGVQSLRIKRFSAVDGASLSITNNPDISNQTKYNILHKTRRAHSQIDTLGAIGCSLSHYSIWKEFLRSDHPYCFVLEDDALVPVGLANQIKLATMTPHTFDVWALSYKLYNKTLNDVTPRGDWKSPVYFWGTSAYIISRKGAAELINQFFPIECHLDNYMCLKNSLGKIRLHIHDNLHMYTLPYGTDIQENTCSLCNFPDKPDGIFVKNSVATAAACSVIYGIIMTIFLFTNNS
jgi:GR25 family glycosyltransferase involved in LPS biosynthesis